MKGLASGMKGRSPLLRYGILIIVVILWYSLVWDTIQSRTESLSDTLQVKEAKVKRLQTKLKKNSGLDAKLKNAQKQYAALEKRLLPGTNPQIVASALQDMLNTAAAEAGLEVTTYRTIKGRKWRNKPVAAVRLTLKGNTEKLVKFLELIRKKNRIVRINSLNIVKVSGRKPYLRINIEAEALWKQGGSA